MSKTEHSPVATYSVPEAARVLGIGRDKAYEAARSGLIPALRFGRNIRVPRVALHRMLESGTGLRDEGSV
jgi:excisionase family DNA binding protein